MSAMREIQGFLERKRIAVIGVSRDARHFSRAIYQAFLERAYDVAPVNPDAEEIRGRKCVATVGEVAPAAEAALVLTPPSKAEQIVTECIDAGIQHIWLYRPSKAAVDRCRAAGVSVVAGECPFMFLPQTQWFHQFHGILRKATLTYPR